MGSLKEQLKALKENRAHLLDEIDAEIRLIKRKISEESWAKKDDKSEAFRVRDELIVKMREEGQTFAQIGATVGVHGSRVKQIVDKAARKKRWERDRIEQARLHKEEMERRDKARTVTVVVIHPILVDGEHMAEGAQVRVTPFIAGKLVLAKRANFATEEDYEAFLVAYPGERKTT